MIEKPDADAFLDTAGIATLREIGELADISTRGVRRFGREAALLAFWSHGVPFAGMGALYVLQARWPDIFGTFWAYAAMVVVFGWYVWKHLAGPRLSSQVRARIEHMDGLEDTATMRTALERSWREGNGTP